MSGRKLNATELKLHQAALADTQKVFLEHNYPVGQKLTSIYLQTLTARETETLVPDANARTAAINFLLGTVHILIFI
jgi:DNA-directed RNA polymerase III subunit RPC6